MFGGAVQKVAAVALLFTLTFCSDDAVDVIGWFSREKISGLNGHKPSVYNYK